MTNLVLNFEPPRGAEGEVQLFGSPVDVWDHIDYALLRPRFEWLMPTFDGAKRVQLGAGFKHIDDWDNLDYPEWDAESENPLPYDDGEVADVVSYHTLDHLSPVAVLRTLAEIQRILRPGGTFVNILPHYMGQLANECLMHKTRWAIDTFRNIFSERQYNHAVDGSWGGWQFEIGHNFIYGITERNLILVTQLVRQ